MRLDARAVRALRPAKPTHDPWRPQGTTIETESVGTGAGLEIARALTIFLTGAECPFTCVFCDLWRHTLDGPTPAGAIPRQIERALAAIDTDAVDAAEVEATKVDVAPLSTVKLYNASNWFDERAVPAADDGAVSALLAPRFRRVVVECHPKLLAGRGGARCRAFAASLAEKCLAEKCLTPPCEKCLAPPETPEARPTRLEVALGFESIHPEALERSGKGVDIDDLRRAAERLRGWDVDLRAFVLVGAPYVPRAERVDWTKRTVALALELGAVHVALIPVRGARASALGRLEERGEWTPPTLDEVEESLARCRPLAPGRVAVDPWDLEQLVDVAGPEAVPDADERIARLRAIAETGCWIDR